LEEEMQKALYRSLEERGGKCYVIKSFRDNPVGQTGSPTELK